MNWGGDLWIIFAVVGVWIVLQIIRRKAGALAQWNGGFRRSPVAMRC